MSTKTLTTAIEKIAPTAILKIDGPFNDFIGTVTDIDADRAKVRVMVSFFGRETPVELDFLQVEKI